jgi:cadmium resistance protein CadD (predicted permease)
MHARGSMLEVVQTIALAAVMFAATNADDLVLLGIFFSQSETRPRTVVLGQLAGIGSLTAISYTASMLTLAVPHTWLPLIGVIPVAIGIRSLCRSLGDDAPPVAITWWAIAGITMANGADNLGVYIPAFAIQTSLQKVLTGVTFGLLTLAWCAVAWCAVRHPSLRPWVGQACRHAAPFVLIGIGLWIIAHHPMFGLGFVAGDDL